MAGVIGKRRLPLLFSVLAGLFLMHGLSVGDSCHGMPPMAMAAPTATATAMGTTPADGAHPHLASDINAAAPAHPMASRVQAGDTCTPLRPEGPASLFPALFFVLAVVSPTPCGARPTHPHWPHGPPRTGVQTLHTLSISRT
jgi:hypothetical protein